MMLSQNFFELEASTVEGQSLQQKDEKRRQRKGTKKEVKKNQKACRSLFILKILISALARAKMSKTWY